ncbi:hypothetical protein VULLAG_LOCUS12275 [Vulpes lagopus]
MTAKKVKVIFTIPLWVQRR